MVERSNEMRDRKYFAGVCMVVLGAASLADHITDGVGNFPISAVVLGLGFVLVCMSYGKK